MAASSFLSAQVRNCGAVSNPSLSPLRPPDQTGLGFQISPNRNYLSPRGRQQPVISPPTPTLALPLLLRQAWEREAFCPTVPHSTGLHGQLTVRACASLCSNCGFQIFFSEASLVRKGFITLNEPVPSLSPPFLLSPSSAPLPITTTH